MEKITNYLELIQQIQDITPEKEAFCTTGKSLTYSQLYALAKEKQGMLKQEKKEFGEQNAKKQLRIIQTTCILDQLVEFLACQGTDWIPVILPADATVPVDEWTQKTWPENACMAVMTSGTSGKNKLLFRTFGSWYDYFPVQNEIFHINSESRLFMQGSLAFTGNLNLYMGQLAAGATILAQERFDPRLWIRNIKQWHKDTLWTDKIMQNLLRISIYKNLILSNRIFCTTPKTIRGRLLIYLSSQASKAESTVFQISFNRQELADYLNLDRSALSKELGKMRDEGILEFRKNQFVLHQLPE